MIINLDCHLDGIWKHLKDTFLGVVIGDELGQDDLFSESEALVSWGLDTKKSKKIKIRNARLLHFPLEERACCSRGWPQSHVFRIPTQTQGQCLFGNLLGFLHQLCRLSSCSVLSPSSVQTAMLNCSYIYLCIHMYSSVFEVKGKMWLLEPFTLAQHQKGTTEQIYI